MSEMTEGDAERKIRATFDQVAIWHGTPLFEPNVGAELRADDDEWPYMAASQMAKSGLDVAAEHLFTIRTLIDAGEILPMAFRSILRTALVAEMYHRHGQYLEALLILNDIQAVPRDQNTETVFDHMTKRGDQIGTVRTLAQEKATWNDTDAIATAACEVWAE